MNRTTSQLEELEKKLGEERSLRQKLENEQEKKTQEIEASWTAVLAEKTSNWEAKEKALEEKVETHDRLLKEVKASYEVSQRLDHNDDGEQPSSATAAELSIVASELEKTSVRLAEAEARNEQLRLDLAQSVSKSQSEQRHRPVEDEPVYLRLQTENSSLLRKLESARFSRETEKSSLEGKLRQCERLTAKITTDRDELRSRLDKVRDYDDIKRELEVIKVRVYSPSLSDAVTDLGVSQSNFLPATMMPLTTQIRYLHLGRAIQRKTT